MAACVGCVASIRFGNGMAAALQETRQSEPRNDGTGEECRRLAASEVARGIEEIADALGMDAVGKTIDTARGGPYLARDLGRAVVEFLGGGPDGSGEPVHRLGAAFLLRFGGRAQLVSDVRGELGRLRRDGADGGAHRILGDVADLGACLARCSARGVDRLRGADRVPRLLEERIGAGRTGLGLAGGTARADAAQRVGAGIEHPATYRMIGRCRLAPGAAAAEGRTADGFAADCHRSRKKGCRCRACRRRCRPHPTELTSRPCPTWPKRRPMASRAPRREHMVDHRPKSGRPWNRWKVSGTGNSWRDPVVQELK